MPTVYINLQNVKKLIDEYYKLTDAQKKAASAANKHKTKLVNAIKDFWRDNKLPAGTTLCYKETEVGYGPTESEYIPVEKWHDMLKNNEITKEQYFEALSVSKSVANKIIGADQVATISIKEMGKRADVRMTDTERDYKDITVKVPVKLAMKKLPPKIAKPLGRKIILRRAP